jgi:hypothetical protein
MHPELPVAIAETHGSLLLTFSASEEEAKEKDRIFADLKVLKRSQSTSVILRCLTGPCSLFLLVVLQVPDVFRWLKRRNHEPLQTSRPHPALHHMHPEMPVTTILPLAATLTAYLLPRARGLKRRIASCGLELMKLAVDRMYPAEMPV